MTALIHYTELRYTEWRFGLRLTLLCGVSVLPVIIITSTPAHAACPTSISTQLTTRQTLTGNCTITNTGKISTGSTALIQNNGTTTLTNNGTIIGRTTAFLISSGTLTTLTNSGVISGAINNGIQNHGTINALIANFGGSITGGIAGIATSGRIGQLSNSGLISGGTNSGITNSGTISTLSNSGTISGGVSGVYNTGVIGQLTNNGAIISMAGDGIGNDTGGTIGTLLNGMLGTISSVGTGVWDNGNIIDMTNDGSITGGSVGVNVLSILGTLTNNGLISGASNGGIENSGTITSFDNTSNGVISSTSAAAINNTGDIGVLTNIGAINAGLTGINNAGGTIGTLSNSGGIGNFGNYGIINGGSIGTLETSGNISANITAVINNANIGTLSNSGAINATLNDGIVNSGTITNLTNAAGGNISVALTGISNSGFIGTLSNSGLITEQNNAAINNSGTITSLTNESTGNLNGITAGVKNSDFIGTLSNSGLITNAATSNAAVTNSATIGTLTNSGTIMSPNAVAVLNSGGMIGTLINSEGGLITGQYTGIFNNGIIGTLSNSGLITGGTYGIYSSGTIDTIFNSGTISGLTGINLFTGGTTLTNSGTIASTNGGDAVLFGGVNTLILTTGSALIGTIAGGGTASQIVLQGTGTLNNTIVGFDSGGSLNVTSGATWTGTGNWTIAQMTNDGVFQGGTLATPLNLTGDYLQNADGTLRVLVTPTTSTAFNVSGTATLAGTVNYLLAPGSYTPHVYPYLTAATVVGSFTTINYGVIPVGDATTEKRGDPTVNLVITAPFTVTDPSAAPAATSSSTTQSATTTPVSTTPALIIAPPDDTIFSAQTQALAQTADADTSSLLGKAVAGGAASSPACAAEAPLSPRNTANGVALPGRLASALASAFCGAGGWVEATGVLSAAGASGGTPSHNADTAGFLAGLDKIINDIGTRLGFAIGYDQTHLADKSGGGGAMGTTRVALYAAQPLGAFTLAGVIAYGNANNNTSRNSGIGDLNENNSVSMWSGGLQVSTELTTHGIELTPAFGMHAASIGGAHFAESASGIASAFAVSGKTAQYNSVQPYVSFTAAKSFVTQSGVTLRPNMEIGYEYEAGMHGVATTLEAADGTMFETGYNALDPGDAILSAGISASRNNWSLFVIYTARIAGNWTSQIADGGLTVRF